MTKTLKVEILKGLPASGKSTYALDLVEKGNGAWKRVNKDDLRAMLDANKWSGANENFVLRMRDTIILEALRTGKNVVVDDTNGDPKHEARIRTIVSAAQLESPVEVVVKEFNTPVWECIKRDRMRAKSVGEKVIRGMYKMFFKNMYALIPIDPALPHAILVDMDGTLSLHTDRGPYEEERCDTDSVNEPVANLVRLYGIAHTDSKIIIVSARHDTVREKTENWLRTNRIPVDMVLMRKATDMREDSIIKKEIYNEHIKGQYNVDFVLDDRRRVVDMWRSLGLTVLQVAEGEF